MNDDHLTAVFCRVLSLPNAEEARMASRKTASGWDSLCQIHLVLALEKEFGVKFSPSEIATLNSYGDFLGAISAKGTMQP